MLTLDVLKQEIAQPISSLDRIRFLILGGVGSGKTVLLGTAPPPVYIMSFDPGGCNSLRKEEEEGKVIVDRRFEGDDPASPKAWALFEKEMLRFLREGLFSQIKTFAIDSTTTWADACAYQIMKSNANQTMIMSWRADYPVLKAKIAYWLHKMTSLLPCHFIMTAHVDMYKDDESRRLIIDILVPGQSRTRQPLYFDEIYVTVPSMVVESGKKKMTVNLLTGRDDVYACARTRFGRGILDTYERADLSYIINKMAGKASGKEVSA